MKPRIDSTIKSEFPLKQWEVMTPEEQTHFERMSEEDVITRWQSQQGEEIKQKIIEINLAYGATKDYASFIGTVKTDLGREPPKIDLRGIGFSKFSNLKENEIFGFDFSNCALHYSDFSGSAFSSSNFSNSNILYSDFTGSQLDECNFSRSNLTLTDFSNSNLETADLRDAWISDVSFEDSNLGYIKFNNRTDFQNIDIAKVRGSSNPLFVSFIRRKHFLKHFKEQNLRNKILYYIWLAISDCGQSFSRWFAVSVLICFGFGYIYSQYSDYFLIANNRPATLFTFYYYSVVTFTTLGFGDVVPTAMVSEVLVTAEVLLGYIMLGGLISIFSTKFIPKD